MKLTNTFLLLLLFLLAKTCSTTREGKAFDRERPAREIRTHDQLELSPTRWLEHEAVEELAQLRSVRRGTFRITLVDAELVRRAVLPATPRQRRCGPRRARPRGVNARRIAAEVIEKSDGDELVAAEKI